MSGAPSYSDSGVEHTKQHLCFVAAGPLSSLLKVSAKEACEPAKSSVTMPPDPSCYWVTRRLQRWPLSDAPSAAQNPCASKSLPSHMVAFSRTLSAGLAARLEHYNAFYGPF
jgi:hypothetical protein